MAKPCPFCGEEAMTYDHPSTDGTRLMYYVGCSNFDGCDVGPSTASFLNTKKAWAVWNARHG